MVQVLKFQLIVIILIIYKNHYILIYICSIYNRYTTLAEERARPIDDAWAFEATIKELLCNHNMEFDKLGILKKGREKIVNKLGVLARSRCLIGAVNWKQVSNGVKDIIFKEIMVTKVKNSL